MLPGRRDCRAWDYDRRAVAFLRPVDVFRGVVVFFRAFFLRVAAALRAADLRRAVVFFLVAAALRAAVFRALDPEDRLPPPLVDCLVDRDPPVLKADWIRRWEALRRTEPPPCNALEVR